jgi:hypothetical protein
MNRSKNLLTVRYLYLDVSAVTYRYSYDFTARILIPNGYLLFCFESITASVAFWIFVFIRMHYRSSEKDLNINLYDGTFGSNALIEFSCISIKTLAFISLHVGHGSVLREFKNLRFHNKQCFGSASVFCGSGSGSYLKTKCGSGSRIRIRIRALTK